MTKPLCPHNDEFGNPCKRQMYALPAEPYPSDGVQITTWQCYSLNTHHQVYRNNPIPGWDNFRDKTKRNTIPPTAKRILPEEKLKILTMLNQGQNYKTISYETGYSEVAIWRIKAITTLAAVSTAIRGMR